MSESENKRGLFSYTLIFVLGVLTGVLLLQRYGSGHSRGGGSGLGRGRGAGQAVQIHYTPGNKLGAVMSVIEENYVDTVDEEATAQAGLDAVLHSLDPHSVYLPARDFEKAEEEIQGNFQGIGVQFRMINDTVTVLQPVSGGPSERAGVQAGDRIIMADRDTLSGKGMATDNIVKILRGPKGTRVRLGLKRAGTEALVWVEVKRDVIPSYSVDVAFMVEPGIGYVKVNKFSATTVKEFNKAVRDLSRQGAQTLIVDLRGNGGGLLTACIEMADMFLSRGQGIVYTEGRNRRRMNVTATGAGRYQDMKLVVMLDEWSASASEIFAGAVQDNDRGVVVGRRSFGKGLVQEQMALSDGSALRLTVARYYTPTGRCIQKSYAGGYEAYEAELLQRYANGEVLGTDSVPAVDTSERFYTPGGRVVYGGGGIMPDVFVPYKTDSLFVYQNQISSRGYSYDFAFRYVDEHRSALKKQYPSARAFTAHFEVSDALFEEFLKYVERKGLARNPRSLEKYGEEIRLTLKALIGRDLYDDEGFYPTYLQRDDDFKAALQSIMDFSPLK